MQGVCAMDHGLRARRIVLIGFSSVRRRRADAEDQLGGARWRERSQGAGCRLCAERLPPGFVGGLSQTMKAGHRRGRRIAGTCCETWNEKSSAAALWASGIIPAARCALSCLCETSGLSVRVVAQ